MKILAKGLTIPVTLLRQQFGNQELSVVLFSPDGKFIDFKPVSSDKAKFDDIALSAPDIKLFILS